MAKNIYKIDLQSSDYADFVTEKSKVG